MAFAIEVKNLTKSFRRNRPVLNALNLKVEDGELVGLIGASGSGKCGNRTDH